MNRAETLDLLISQICGLSIQLEAPTPLNSRFSDVSVLFPVQSPLIVYLAVECDEENDDSKRRCSFKSSSRDGLFRFRVPLIESNRERRRFHLFTRCEEGDMNN
jgi:hypothetical protein